MKKRFLSRQRIDIPLSKLFYFKILIKTFDPHFGQKLLKIVKIPDLPNFRQAFGKKGGLNIMRFEIWGQIWNPLIIKLFLGPF